MWLSVGFCIQYSAENSDCLFDETTKILPVVEKVPFVIWHLSVSHRSDWYSVISPKWKITVLRHFCSLLNMTDYEKRLDISFLKMNITELSGAVRIMLATGGEVICNFLCLSIL